MDNIPGFRTGHRVLLGRIADWKPKPWSSSNSRQLFLTLKGLLSAEAYAMLISLIDY